MLTLTYHATKQAAAKGIAVDLVLDAANDPTITYANGRFAGQMRHIRGNVVAVVDPAAQRVITVYENVRETALRPDQQDRDALQYGARKGK